MVKKLYDSPPAIELPKLIPLPLGPAVPVGQKIETLRPLPGFMQTIWRVTNKVLDFSSLLKLHVQSSFGVGIRNFTPVCGSYVWTSLVESWLTFIVQLPALASVAINSEIKIAILM